MAMVPRRDRAGAVNGGQRLWRRLPVRSAGRAVGGDAPSGAGHVGGPEVPQQPRSLRGEAVAARLARIDEAHVRALNDIVREVNAGRAEGEIAPWFDPDGGGVDACVLCLFESPGPSAAGPGGSGLVSADNDDPASETFFALRDEAGLARGSLVAWNVVPWPLRSVAGRARAAVAADIADAEPWLHRVVGELSELRAVVTFGTAARDGWLRLLTTREDVPLVPTLAVSQTSPNAIRVGDSRARMLLALRRAAQMCG